MQRNFFWVWVLIAFAVGILVGRGFVNNERGAEPMLLKVGLQTSPAMALPMIARDRGFFDKQGLAVELVEFTAGKFALQAFFGGSLDMAISGDVPVALSVLQGNKTSVIGQVVEKTVNEVRVVARKDTTALSAEEYFRNKKRKLATSFGGGPEFFTYEFLNALGLKPEQVELISQKPEDMPAALVSGSVDAVSIFDPFAFFAERELGEQAKTFTNEHIYSELYVLNASEALTVKPEVIKKFLNALIEAEVFIEEHPDEARSIVARYTKLDDATLKEVWGSFVFKVALTDKLLEFWQRETDWARATKKVSAETPMPNFKSLIFAEPLRALKSERVTY